MTAKLYQFPPARVVRMSPAARDAMRTEAIAAYEQLRRGIEAEDAAIQRTLREIQHATEWRKL